MDRIGVRIKRKREELQMQMNDLAKRVGISPSALSQIEKAKAFPSIVTLKHIAEHLNTTVGELIGENEVMPDEPVFRCEERLLIKKNVSEAQLYLLTQHDVKKHISPMLITFEQGSDSRELFTHFSGFMYAYLSKGELLFEIDNKSYVLQVGDGIYFNTKRNFRLENIHSGKSELLCVTTKV